VGCPNRWVATVRSSGFLRRRQYRGVWSRWSFPAGQPPRGGCDSLDTRSVLTHVSGSLSGREVSWQPSLCGADLPENCINRFESQSILPSDQRIPYQGTNGLVGCRLRSEHRGNRSNPRASSPDGQRLPGLCYGGGPPSARTRDPQASGTRSPWPSVRIVNRAAPALLGGGPISVRGAPR
jgi:hypothetical protein